MIVDSRDQSPLERFDIADYQTRTMVPLKCKDGSYHGSVVNGTFLRVLCRRAHAAPGYRTYHLFDLVTGMHVRDEEEYVGRDSRQGVG